MQAHVDSDMPGRYTVVFGLQLLLLFNAESLCHTTIEQKIQTEGALLYHPPHHFNIEADD